MSNRKTAAYIIFVSLAMVLAAIIGVAIRFNVHKPPVVDFVQASLDDTLVLDHSEIKVDSDIITPTNKIDAAPFLTFGPGGFTVYHEGKVKDSVWDDQWYTCNFKSVPQYGLFVDTAIYTDVVSQNVSVLIIRNRRRIAEFSFARPKESSGWYWSTNIDKNALTPPTPERPWTFTDDSYGSSGTIQLKPRPSQPVTIKTRL